ncbi:MAG: hypothetical protein F7C34_00985 [Desulfurococcales archaeon]|nr:hypothetical protein [Desulfurococcales archaeon]
MPRIDRGSLIVEISSILRLPREDRIRLLERAAEEGAILVTAPSLVHVYAPSGALRIAVGPGSLVLPPGSDLGVVKHYEASAAEWVDGCRMKPHVSPRQARYEPVSGERLSGRLVPGDLRDPLSLFLTGAEAVASGSKPREPPVAAIGLETVVWYENGEVATTINKGCEAAERLDYILRALSYCSREE